MKKLSIVIPVYNEINTLETVLNAVLKAPIYNLDKEIILIDDYSKDGTREYLKSIENKSSNIKIIFQEKNQGKGSALRTGFQATTGDYIVVQDADLEYDPNEYEKLLAPLLSGKADVVFGTRFSSGEPHRVLYFWHSVGNRFLTLLSNIFTNLNLTDMEVCYKIFKKEIIDQITIEENRFGFEPEITAKVARLKCRIFEVGISYNGRTYKEGKKITWKDGFRAIYVILKYGLFEK